MGVSKQVIHWLGVNIKFVLKKIETVNASLIPSEELFSSLNDLLKSGLFVIDPYKWLKNNFRSHYNFNSGEHLIS